MLCPTPSSSSLSVHGAIFTGSIHVAQVSLHGDPHVARPAAATEDPGCVIGSLRCFSEPRSGTSSAKTTESRPT
ncbi:hypothetical protein EYF80_029646 [Liparis tanakae]|uniref:Uncharacterized protein n=1 Tax=Liparis tanakae TaxID=230148 RepID=A0A4Z2H5I9_9TELE|nr:hypothetical protein EYF80_029646 [Liparis tanakae]